MVNVYNAEDILAIKKCGDLFTNNYDTMRKEYHMLVKMWHPDVNHDKDANIVFNYIKTLYIQADKLIKAHTWEVSNQLMFTSDKNQKIVINFQLEKSFELGKCYICSDRIVYVVDYDKKYFVDNAAKVINGFEFADDKMETEMRKFLPKITNYYVTNDKKYVALEILKTSDMLPLSEVLKFYKNEIPHRHVAWMISRLNNILCYLQWAGLAHNGISLDTCFISPLYHSVVIYGGWWYTQKLNEPLVATSKAVFDSMVFSIKKNLISSTITDIECVKALSKQILGKSEVPIPFNNYLTHTTSKTAFKNYDEWNTVLTESYGERKFIPMELDENELYSR